MKILYAIQGTGNGHLSRARDVIPALQKFAEVDILLSSSQAEVKLPYDIKYRCRGLGFVFGKNGGIDLLSTLVQSNLKSFLNEVSTIPVEQYELVINDFEPVSAWGCKLKKVPCIGLSHQAAVLAKEAPQPKKENALGRKIIRNYAPANYNYGFHFSAYNTDIFTPIIRQQIREQTPKNKGHYTVYLPAYADERIIKKLKMFPDVEWQVFSKNCQKNTKIGSISIQPIDNDRFVKSMAKAEGVLCGAGFETPSEALYLGKKLLVIPMKQQFEQHCNAAALEHMGVPILKSFKKKHLATLSNWVDGYDSIQVNFPDQTEMIVEKILDEFSSARHFQNQRKQINTSTISRLIGL